MSTASASERATHEPHPQTEQESMAGTPRRTIVKGAAWSVPVIAAAIAAPVQAASNATAACTGCFSWDPTHQNLAKPPADTWVTAPIDNVDTPRTYGTALVAYYSLKYTCTLPATVRYVSYLVNFDSNLQGATGATVTTSDGGTVQPVYNPAGVVTVPGAGGGAVAGVAWGPSSGVPSTSNVSGLGYAVIYAGNVGWSAPATDLTSGPSLLHHLTGAAFTATVQFTTVNMDGTVKTSSCAVRIRLQLVSPYPGTAYLPTQSLYWQSGALTATTA